MCNIIGYKYIESEDGYLESYKESIYKLKAEYQINTLRCLRKYRETLFEDLLNYMLQCQRIINHWQGCVEGILCGMLIGITGKLISSNLTKAIGEYYGLEVIEVLTGFKNIGAIMRKAEENNDKKYVFGFEESYGCLIGDYARDKDGIAAVMALCEAACYYKSKNKTLWDQMNDIYEKYGYYKEAQVSIVREGAEGAEEIKQMMTNTRNKDIEKIGDYKVLTFKDIEKDYVKNMISGEITKTGLPKSNVLYYELEDNSWCCVRPSGTEPKIKLYMGIKGKTDDDANEKLEKLKTAMLKIVNGD